MPSRPVLPVLRTAAIAAAMLASLPARASFLSGDALDTAANVLSWVVLVVVPVVGIVVFWLIHILPEKIAEQRRHPQAKAIQTLEEMERRLAAFGLTWADTTAVQVYTVYDLHPFFLDEIARRGAAENGLTWHPCRPPVQKVDFEMDCRGLVDEKVLRV